MMPAKPNAPTVSSTIDRESYSSTIHRELFLETRTIVCRWPPPLPRDLREPTSDQHDGVSGREA
eukprot:7217488-Prymnesium_polylepis.1